MLDYLIDSLDSVDEHFHSEYTEVDGKFQLQLQGGPSDQAGDVSRLKGSLDKERDAHKATKSRLSNLGGITPEEIQELRDKAEDLEFKLEKSGESNDEAIEERAEKLAARKTRKLEEQINTLTGDNANYISAISLHEAAGNQRRIKDAVESALIGDDSLKVVDSAREDILPFAERIMTINEDGNVVSKDGVGYEPGLTFIEILSDLQVAGKRGHWFEGNKSAGAGGGEGSDLGGVNPFKDGTLNAAAQRLVVDDPKRAKSLILAAGQKLSKYGLAA